MVSNNRRPSPSQDEVVVVTGAMGCANNCRFTGNRSYELLCMIMSRTQKFTSMQSSFVRNFLKPSHRQNAWLWTIGNCKIQTISCQCRDKDIGNKLKLCRRKQLDWTFIWGHYDYARRQGRGGGEGDKMTSILFHWTYRVISFVQFALVRNVATQSWTKWGGGGCVGGMEGNSS